MAPRTAMRLYKKNAKIGCLLQTMDAVCVFKSTIVCNTNCLHRSIYLRPLWYQWVEICKVAQQLHIVVGRWSHVVVRNHVSTLSLYLGDRGMSGTLGILSSRKMPPRCRLMTLTYSKFTMYERWQRTMLVSVR